MRQLRSLLLHAEDVPEGNSRTAFQGKHPGIFIDLFYNAGCGFVRASRFAIIRLEKNNGNNMTGVSFDATLQIMETGQRDRSEASVGDSLKRDAVNQ